MRRYAQIVTLAGALISSAAGQYGGGTGGGTGPGATGGGAKGGGGMTGVVTAPPPASVSPLYGRLNFDRPESWALKYFASTMLLSGLTPAEPPVETPHRFPITVGVELGWLPTLDAGQQRVGFNGTSPEDLNKAPLMIKPQVRVGLPWQFTAIVAGPPPFEVFGIRPHLLDLGLERPLLQRRRWTLGWRGYGQLGTVKGAFTCSSSAVAAPLNSYNNPQNCIGESTDVATLRYVGTELQFSYRSRRMPRLVPHVASGVNYIDGSFQVDAPLRGGVDHNSLWTRGFTVSESGGASYLINDKVAFTVDMFYSPLLVQRNIGAPRTNDGLLNVRALVSYNFR